MKCCDAIGSHAHISSALCVFCLVLNFLFFDCFLVPSGICSDIAGSKYEHWSALAPLPFEVVISAGQKAKDDSDRG